ncbi:TPA: hypothetical protein IFC62_004927 [Escherichia coli]|nr:hypothetical protein [Escherichia coli]
MKLRTRNRLMDALYNEQLSLNEVKRQLMYTYQFPARIAKQRAKELLKEAIEYWESDSY